MTLATSDPISAAGFAPQRAIAIRATGLVKRYGSVEAVRGIDLDVRAGEVFGFVGPNGAGKSTTIRCLLDLIRPTGGSVEVLGKSTSPRRRGDPTSGRVRPRRASPARADDRPAARRVDRQDPRRFRNVVGRRPIAERLPSISTGRPRAFDRQSAEGRAAAGVRAEADLLDPRRADERPRPADAARVPRDGRRGTRRRGDRLPVIARPERGPARRRSRRGPSRRADRGQGTVDELRGRARQRIEVWFADDVDGAGAARRSPGLDATGRRRQAVGGDAVRDRSIRSLRSWPGIPSRASSWRNRTSRTPSSICMVTTS